MSMKSTSHLGYAGVYLFFLFLFQKHTLSVLLRAASARRFKRVPTIYVLGKNKKNIKFLLIEFSIFTAKKISV